jgi:hypothetical protein
MADAALGSTRVEHPTHSNLDVPVAAAGLPIVKSLEAYQALFQGASDHKAIGEASPLYLADPRAPQCSGATYRTPS